MQKRWQKEKTGVGVARPTKMRVVRLNLANARVEGVGLQGAMAGTLRFAKPSTWVLNLANARVEVVFGSPVRSGFLTPRAIDRDRNRSFYFRIVQKTGLNRYRPVFCGLLWLMNRP